MLEQLLAPAIFAIFAIGFALIWHQNREVKAAGIWAASYFFGFLSFSSTPLINSFSQLEPFRPVSDTFYLMSPVLFVVGVGFRYTLKLPRRLLALIFLTSLSVVYWHWFIVDSYSIRAEAISYGCAALFAVGAWMLYQTLETHRTHLLFWIVTILSLIHI